LNAAQSLRHDKKRIGHRAFAQGLFSGVIMANGRAFTVGCIFSILGTALLLYMMHDTAWMVRENSEGSNVERFEFGLYSSTLQYSEDNKTVMAYGNEDEWVTANCEESSNSNSTNDEKAKMCEIITAGDTGHWILISGVILVVIALILGGIGMSGYIPGWIPMMLNVVATLVIIVGSIMWLVQFPELNQNSDDPRLSPSYGFYASLGSTALITLGGLAWGGIDAFQIVKDDDADDDDEWHDAMATADPNSANWRDQQVPTSTTGTEAPHQYQQEQMMQQYEYQDQGYHHQQSYAEPRQDWQRSAPRSGPSSATPAPSSGPPGSTATPSSGPTGPSSAPSSGPPGPSAPPRSGPPGSTATPSSGPPGPQSAQRQGPPGSTYGQPQQPKVRKASQPAQQPVSAAPPAQQPAPVAPPAQQPAPAQQIPSTQQLQQYIAPHQMPSTAQSTPPPEVKGQVRPDGWEIIEWPQGSSRWFWKNQKTGQWSRWT